MERERRLLQIHTVFGFGMVCASQAKQTLERNGYGIVMMIVPGGDGGGTLEKCQMYPPPLTLQRKVVLVKAGH